MATYGQLQAKIASDIKRGNLGTQIQDAILAAISHYKRREFWFLQEEKTTLTTTASEYALPSDFLDFRTKHPVWLQHAGSTSGHPLTKRSYNWIKDRTIGIVTTARPLDWAYYENAIHVYPFGLAGDTLSILYQKLLPELSASGDENAWTDHGFELIRARAKWDLYLHTIQNGAMAGEMKRAELEALSEVLRGNQNVGSGEVKASYL